MNRQEPDLIGEHLMATDGDERLLEALDNLRLVLARALKNRNSQLESETLTELTQRILDRLVFIRFLEDKLIEPDPIIPKLGKSTGRTAWEDFLSICRRLDETYNGIVFKYHDVLDQPGALDIDEKVFDDILNGRNRSPVRWRAAIPAC